MSEWGVLRRQLLQQRLRLLQIARVEPFSEPAVNRSEQFASLLRLALVTPEAREAHGGAEFQEFRLLRACYRKGLSERGLSRIAVIDRTGKKKLSLDAVDFR